MNTTIIKLFDCVSPLIGFPFKRDNQIPIIYYHSIVNEEGFSYQYVNYVLFKAQMDYLIKEKYSFLSFSDLKNDFKKGTKDKVILIAFDDGFEDNYSLIFDYMRYHLIKYNVFLVTSFIDKIGYLSKSQIKEMYNSGIVDFGVHTHSHIDCVKSYDRLEKEIEISNYHFSSLLGYKPMDFCFPFGSYSSDVVKLINEIGEYKRLYSSDYRKVVSLSNSCLTGRIGIRNEDSVRIFKHKVNGFYYVVNQLYEQSISI